MNGFIELWSTEEKPEKKRYRKIKSPDKQPIKDDNDPTEIKFSNMYSMKRVLKYNF